MTTVDAAEPNDQQPVRETSLSRRRTMALGGLGSLIASGVMAPGLVAEAADSDDLPIKEIKEIMQASGTFSHGVLNINMDRKELKASLPGNIAVTAAELLNAAFFFQSAGDGKAIMNANICLKPSETQGFIDALIKNGLTIQAFHQHLTDLTPMVWFIHFRGMGAPKPLAQAARDVLGATSIMLPQHPPKHLPTPFDKKKLEGILGGHAQVGSSGVVTVSVDRAEEIHLGGVKVHPGLGMAATIAFQPLDHQGTQALAIPDFALIAPEVDGVLKTMRAQGFTVGCLYNQETDEVPQLYFSHMWATGDVYDLARKIRNGLNRTHSKFKG